MPNDNVLTGEQWYDLASRHANADWSGNGYLAAVKALCDDYRAVLAAHPGQLEPRVAGAIPRVHGVSGFADNPCTVLVMLMAEATDDALRAIHDRLTCQPEPRAEVTECCDHTWASCHKGEGCEFRMWLAARTGASS